MSSKDRVSYAKALRDEGEERENSFAKVGLFRIFLTIIHRKSIEFGGRQSRIPGHRNGFRKAF